MNRLLPLGVKRKLRARIAKENTSICEQVFFAWFRNFAAIMNGMKANRHTCFLLNMAKRHNEAIAKNKAGYLHPTSSAKTSKKSKPYKCSMKSMKVKK